MENLYQKIKGLLAKADTLHVFLSFMLSIVIAGVFNLMGTADKWVMIIVCPILAFFVGLFGEHFDSKISGNEFSHKDLVRNIIGCVLAMVAIGILVL